MKASCQEWHIQVTFLALCLKYLLSSVIENVFHLWGTTRTRAIVCMWGKSLGQPYSMTQKKASHYWCWVFLRWFLVLVESIVSPDEEILFKLYMILYIDKLVFWGSFKVANSMIQASLLLSYSLLLRLCAFSSLITAHPFSHFSIISLVPCYFYLYHFPTPIPEMVCTCICQCGTWSLQWEHMTLVGS